MKLLQINSVCGYGSTGKIVLDLYNMLESKGHTCCIAFGRGTAPKGIKTIKIGSQLGVDLHCILSRITDRHGLYSKYATKKLIDKIREYDPDIIHVHNIHGYYVNYKILFEYLHKCDKPVIWTLHDCWTFTGHCAHFDYCGCEKWKVNCFKCPQLKQYPSSYFIDNSYQNLVLKRSIFSTLNNLTLIVPSMWLKQIVDQSFFNKCDCRTIYNGIDLDIFSFRESDLRLKYNLKNKIIILGVSNIWNKRKGIGIFQELSKKLPEQYQVVLVGLNNKQMKKLPSNILGLPITKNTKELSKWYSTADLYFNASVEETMGLTTVEALACGTPVLVFNKTAIPEVVNERCGKILPYVNIDEICLSIVETNWSGFSKEACRMQASLFDKTQKYDEYYKVYCEKLEEQGKD